MFFWITSGMRKLIRLKWLNKLVTSTRNFITQFFLRYIWFIVSNHFGNAWPHPLEMIEKICNLPNHMKKAQLLTQLILEIKLAHYLASFWACPDVPDYTQPHFWVILGNENWASSPFLLYNSNLMQKIRKNELFL